MSAETYTIALCHSTTGRWVAATEFGHEAPDSPMAAGAAYGMGETPTEALFKLASYLEPSGQNYTLVKATQPFPEPVSDATPAERYAAGLNALENDINRDMPYHFEVMEGNRWDKIVVTPYGQSSGSVHAFVDRTTGQVHKAESWKKPVAKPRYGTVEKALEAAKHCGKSFAFGGYLYQGAGL